jgi:protein involved in polysaccharide export with SLBB domain
MPLAVLALSLASLWPHLPAQTEYRLRERDILRVRYFLGIEGIPNPGLEAITQAFTQPVELEIPPGGIVAFPLIGNLHAEGKTVTELSREITESLRKRFPTAECVLILSRVQPLFFSIIGEVQKGGQFPLPPGLTLREALALAGGTLQRPETLQATLFRNGKPYKTFDLYALSAQDDPTARETILHGDVISVHTRRQARIWVSGAGVTAGEQMLEEGWGIKELLARVLQAPTERREQLQVVVVRRGERVFQSSVYDVEAHRSPNFALQEGDFVSFLMPETLRVWVLGAVNVPGQYDIPKPGTLSHALAHAGGLRPDGTARHVTLLRSKKQLTLDALSPEGMNAELQNGDIILVSENMRRIAVFGEVYRPGVYFLRDEMEATVADAIGMAGGLTKRGPANRVSILRVQENGTVQRIPVDFGRFLQRGEKDYNPPVLPGDIIMIGETPRIDVQNIVSVIVGLLGLRNLFRP